MSICLFVCLSVCLFSKLVSGSSYTVENASSAALVPRSPEMKPPLAAIGSATVAVLPQSSGVERPFFAIRRGHVVYNICALYIHVVHTVPWLLLLYSKTVPWLLLLYSSKRVVSATRGLCSRNTI